MVHLTKGRCFSVTMPSLPVVPVPICAKTDFGQPSSFARTSAPSTGVPWRVTTTLTVAAGSFIKSNGVVSPALRSSSALPLILPERSVTETIALPGGNSCEFKNCILFDGCEVPHFNYVGDAILGYKAHLGAGVILSNVRLDRAEVGGAKSWGNPNARGVRQ